MDKPPSLGSVSTLPRRSATPAPDYRRMVEAVEDYAIFMLDANGVILSWNRGAQRLKAYEADEIIGRHFSIFYPPELLARRWPEHELAVAVQVGKYEEEGWRLRKDGTRFWASVTITRIDGDQGQVLGFVKVTRDLTDRQRQQEEIRASEQRFRLLVDSVKDYAIFMLDPSGHVVSWNAGARANTLAGCPPCQGFSRLRTRNQKTYVQDDRNNLVSDFLRFVKAMNPKSVMLENVPSLGRDGRFTKMRNQLISLGYEVIVHVLDAADYRVPQRRKRLIMLASRVHTPALAPAAQQRVTVRQALSGLTPPSRTKDKLHAIPENRSQAVRDLIKLIPKNGGSRSDLGREHQLACHLRSDGFKDVYGRMAWDDVSPTITSGCHNPSKGRFLHPSQNRTITLREAALLQGFPSDYRFDVSHGKEAIALMIGNALPPPFIAAHAGSLRQGLLSVCQSTASAGRGAALE